jgi:hypothetical protein
MCGSRALEAGEMQFSPSSVIPGGAKRREGDQAVSFMQPNSRATFIDLTAGSPSRPCGSPGMTREGGAEFTSLTTTAHCKDQTDAE